MSERQGHISEDFHHGTPRPGSQIERDNVEIKKGHRYEYHGVEGSMQTSTGVVTDILTHADIAGSTHKLVKASENEPRYVVRNDHTGKETAYYKRAFERELGPGQDIHQYHLPQTSGGVGEPFQQSAGGQQDQYGETHPPEYTAHLDRDGHRGTPRVGSEIEKFNVEIKKAYRYEYHPVEGGGQTAIGVVVDILTKPEAFGGRTVNASQDEPRYLIRNDHTGKVTAYYKKAFERELGYAE